MKLVVFSASKSVSLHLKSIVDCPVEIHTEFHVPGADRGIIYLVNISSMGSECLAWVEKYANDSTIIAMSSDKPDIREMLEFVRLGAKSYCNSFMQPTHIAQMIDLLCRGQSWFPPQMIEQTFELAHQTINGKDTTALMADLTMREQDIALAITEGKSNREIACQLEITEPTVKTHLTNIFKKLQLKDRVALVLYLK